MTTLIAAVSVGGFLFLALVMLPLGFPSRRSFLDAMLYAAKHVARFAWALQAGIDVGLREFRMVARAITVPDLLRVAPCEPVAEAAEVRASAVNQAFERGVHARR